MLGATSIGAGTKIDNLVQVGHNVVVGDRSILCGQVGIAGSARVGSGVVMGGRAGSAGHLTIGDGAQLAAAAVVLQSVDAGTAVAGVPAIPIAAWRRQQAIFRRLPEIWKRLRALEQKTGTKDGGDDRDSGHAGGAGDAREA